MENTDSEIHIALAFDENFITPFYVLLTSIFDNNKKKYFDFTWTVYSFKGYIFIRILEFYLEYPWIKNSWKKIKELKPTLHSVLKS